MRFVETTLEGVFLVEPRVFEDRRGFFFECFNRKRFREAGIDVDFVQDNHSESRRHTLRGLHYQAPPHAQDKLVRAVRGEVFDVVVDIRSSSPTFGQWAGFTLSAENRTMLFVPKGFAHGFCVTSDTAEIVYKCSDFYAPKAGRGIRWDDPDLAISWPVTSPILSEKDQNNPAFADLPGVFDDQVGP